MAAENILKIMLQRVINAENDQEYFLQVYGIIITVVCRTFLN